MKTDVGAEEVAASTPALTTPDAPPMATLRALATLFTRPLFASMGVSGSLAEVRRKLARNKGLRVAAERPLRDLFDQTYSILVEHYRNEYVFKVAVVRHALTTLDAPGKGSVQIELPVFSSILDVAVTSDTTTAFEIKTDLDSVRRLESQSTNYLKVFDRVVVLGTDRTLPALSRNLDPRVGLAALQTDGTLTHVREALENRQNLQSYQICWGLRKAERVAALERRLGVKIRVPGGLLGQHCVKHFADIPPLELHEIYLEAMQRRSDAVLKDGFIQRLPASLQALGFATPLSGIGRRRVLELLETGVALAPDV
jgi:hypothetical protein